MIVLVGFMGAGKTTAGRLLAARLGLPFADSDLVIEDQVGQPVRQFFADHGEPAFRQLEHEVIAGLLAGPSRVLAVGGGAAGHPGTRALLATVPVVYLRVSYAAAMNRVGGDPDRPMLARPGVEQLYAARHLVYAETATCTVDTDARSPQEVALDIAARLPSAVSDS
jgi:shikimate kinase